MMPAYLRSMGVVEDHATSKGKALIRELNHRIRNNQRLALIDCGYHGAELEAMGKELFGHRLYRRVRQKS